MISVIIPVYNVEKYIDRCMDTVVRQTFEDIEILLIDNNSNEATRAKEEEWAKRDRRVRLLYEKEQGLGPARNKGLEEARGIHICFVDPDDWIEPTMMEKMYGRILEEDADICICNQVHMNYDIFGRIVYRPWYVPQLAMGKAKNVNDDAAILMKTLPSAYGKLYQRDLFMDNNIRFPNCTAEDRPVSLQLTYKAKSICTIPENLYFYHAARPGSNMSMVGRYESLPSCVDEIIQPFLCDDAFQQFLPALRYACIEAAKIITNPMPQVKDIFKTEKGRTLLRRTLQRIAHYFPEKKHTQYVIGSYGLRREAWFAYPSTIEIRKHIQHSNMVSLMSAPIHMEPEVQYRDGGNEGEWLDNDLRKTILNEWMPNSEDYLFLDFLEDRHPILMAQGSYFTGSEIFYETYGIDTFFQSVDSDSREGRLLWEEKCDSFIEWARTRFQASHTILVRHLLCLRHGEYCGTALFLNQDELARVNERLNQEYDYFIDHCPGIYVIDTHMEDGFFAHEGFPLGCAPYRVNDYYYMSQGYRIAKKIYCQIDEQSGEEVL